MGATPPPSTTVLVCDLPERWKAAGGWRQAGGWRPTVVGGAECLSCRL
jgi:hypothetical protein